MSDLEVIYVILVLFYLWECLVWLPRGQVLFWKSWFGGWRAGHPSPLVGNLRGGVVVAPLLPPSAACHLASQAPWSLAPQGLLAFVAASVNPGWRPPQTGRFVPFAELQEVVWSPPRLRLNGQTWMKAKAGHLARPWQALLARLRAAAAPARKGLIEEFLAGTLAWEKARDAWREFEEKTGRLRWAGHWLFAYCYGVMPGVVWYFGFTLVWKWVLLALLASTLAPALMFRKLHRHFYPLEDEERFSLFAVMLLSPANAIRARDSLARPLLVRFHPLAVARALLDEEAFQAFAMAYHRELCHPAWPLPSGAAGEMEAGAREAWTSLVEAFLVRNGVDRASLNRPPARADATCQAYCPRCLAQYTQAGTGCPDCGGLPQVAFSAPAGSPSVRTG